MNKTVEANKISKDDIVEMCKKHCNFRVIDIESDPHSSNMYIKGYTMYPMNYIEATLALSNDETKSMHNVRNFLKEKLG